MVCATEVHEAMKSDPNVWRSLPFVGVQRLGDGIPVIELRNCNARGCHSTIGIEITEGALR